MKLEVTIDSDDYVVGFARLLEDAGFPTKIGITARGTDSGEGPTLDSAFVLVGLPPENPTRWVRYPELA